MRISIVVFSVALLFVAVPARQAEALAGYYRQYHRTYASKQYPTKYNWDAKLAKCRRTN
jgi:hypothetical protein